MMILSIAMNTLFTLGVAAFTVTAYLNLNLGYTPEVLPVDLSDPEPVLIEREVAFYRDSPISISEKDMKCLTENIFYEAGIEDYYGKIAVAQVTYNRLKTGRWGRSICSVVHAPHQFSWTKQKLEKPRGPLWAESKRAANDFISGLRVMGLQKSLFYHATWINKPHWTEAKQEIVTIGQHVFYSKVK